MSKTTLSLIAGCCLTLGTHASADQQAPVLIELFTSQGCYSCPPADDALGELAKRDDVIALAFHVTYWDRLGWPDTFGQEQFTQRQYAYAQTFQSRSVYTPQAVVAGEIDVVGSRKSTLERAVDYVRLNGAASLVEFAEDQALLPPTAVDPQTKLWLAAYERLETVDIPRGENGGKTLDYHHIVKDFRDLGDWDGQAQALPLAFDEWRGLGLDGVVVVAQSAATGRILAVGEHKF